MTIIEGVTSPTTSSAGSSSATGRRYGGKTTEERRAQRREKLLDAALELFGTVGAAGTTIEMLCATAQLNPRYFYEEFKTREALLKAVYDRHVDSVLTAVAQALQSAPTEPRARLEAGLRAFVDGALKDDRAARVNYFEMVGVSRELEERRREVLRLYADVIASEIGTLEQFADRSAADKKLAAVALVGATDGLIIDWLSGPRRVKVEALIDTLLDLFAPSGNAHAPRVRPRAR